jgi:hypothetical protein
MDISPLEGSIWENRELYVWHGSRMESCLHSVKPIPHKKGAQNEAESGTWTVDPGFGNFD